MTESTHSDRLSDIDLADFRTALDSLSIELERLTTLEREGGTNSGPTLTFAPRFADVTVHGRLPQQLSAVNRARTRLDEGRFGACEVCGKQIAVGRLEVIPWADTCVGCS
ncbi:MAG TPA: TraR/DksA C4-type zinc finger protein [Ilumatobacter sp.]|nr:TraR/DksA C4-type zinc finger protein [Ilumatobacter sp.]